MTSCRQSPDGDGFAPSFAFRLQTLSTCRLARWQHLCPLCRERPPAMHRRAGRLEERMFARLMIAALVLAGLSTPAAAQTENLQIFRAVQRQVLQYPHFTMFDSVHA